MKQETSGTKDIKNNVAPLLPLEAVRKMHPALKQSIEDKLIDYIISETGSVSLTDKEMERYDRMLVADGFLRKFRRRKVASKLLMDKYGYSSLLAQRDIELAEHVMGSTARINKNYLLSRHLDRLEDALALAQQQNNAALAARLYDSYTKALSLIPEHVDRKPPPSAIIYNITQINMQEGEPETTEAEAMVIAEQKLQQQGINIKELLEDE